MGREDHLRKRLIDCEEMEREPGRWRSLKNRSGQSEGMRDWRLGGISESE